MTREQAYEIDNPKRSSTLASFVVTVLSLTFGGMIIALLYAAVDLGVIKL